MVKILKREINIEHIQMFFLFILIYEMVIKRTFKYDNILIISLMGVTLYKNRKISFEKNMKKLYILIFINAFIFLLSYYKVLKLNKFVLDERFDMVNSIVFKSFLLFLIGLNLNIEYRKLKYIIPFICVASISPLVKITNFGLKYGFFKTRIMNLWGHANYVGFFLGMITIFSIVTAIFFKEKILKIVGYILGSWAFFLLISCSRSRNAILSLLLSLIVLSGVYIFKLKINKKKILSIVFLFSGLLMVLIKFDKRFESLFKLNSLLKDGRIYILKTTVEILKKEETNVFFGKGFSFYFNNLNTGYENLSSFHNDYIEILINQGVLGLFFYLLLTLCVLYLIVKNIKNNDFKNSIFSILALLLWVYIFILGQFDNVIYSNRIFEMAYFMFGIGISKNYIGENSKNDKENEEIF